MLLNDTSLYLLEMMTSLNYYAMVSVRVRVIPVLILSPFGVVGSVLCMLVLVGEPYRNQLPFVQLMFITCLSDLAFNVVNSAITTITTIAKRLQQHSWLASWFCCYSLGFSAYFSLLSDLMTVLLALERYLSLCAPIYWRSFKTQAKRKTFSALCALFAVFCLMRFSKSIAYRVSSVVFINETIYDIELRDVSKSRWYRYFCISTEVAVPCLSVMAMTFFTVAVSRRAAALVPRRPKHRSKVNPQDHVLTPAAPTTAAVNASATAIRKQISIIPWFSGIRSGIMPAPSRRLPAGFKLNSNGITCLVVIVGSAFVVEQLSYLADAARYFMSTDIELLDDNSSRWKVDQQFSKALYYSITDCLVNVSQVVAHSIHFYCFLTFSRTFRNTFYRRMSKIKHSVVFFTRLLKNLLWP